ncbi:MAG: cytoplasmic protein [Solirubrobacteraceae bacterium]|nr:cytoplasmic protein [Solirubrobacteraceae bacterium]
MSRILLVGESWVTQTTHIKGVDHFTATAYEEGTEWMLRALAAHDVEHLPAHLVPSSFPSSFEDYDAVIISDVGADSVLLHPATLAQSVRTPDRLAALRDFVLGGGGLAMIGGWMSFSGYEGRAKYGRTAIADVLPAWMHDGDDRFEAPAGVTPSVVAPDHPILEGLPSEWPWFLGYNRLFTRDDCEVLLTCGPDPFLAVGSFGTGRSLVFASDCAPHWAPPAFLEWEHHDRFWGQAVGWLCDSGG